MVVSRTTRTLILITVIVAVLIVLRLLDRTIAPSISDLLGIEVLDALGTPWFVLGGTPPEAPTGLAVTPLLMIRITLFLILITLLSRFSRGFLHTRVLSHTSLDEGQKYAGARIFGYGVFVFGVMAGLKWMGLDLTSLTILGGAIGIGVGFGMQSIINNFVSGLILLLERPIKIGDRIEVGTTTGEVVKIGARSTWIRGIDNVVTMVPNSEFITGRVSNWTAMGPASRFHISVNVALDSDPKHVRDLLLGVARDHLQVVADPAPDVVLHGIGENALRFDLRFSTATMAQAPQRISSELYFAILEVFRREAVEIPYPQREMRVRPAPPGAVAPQGEAR